MAGMPSAKLRLGGACPMPIQHRVWHCSRLPTEIITLTTDSQPLRTLTSHSDLM
uniref:Uncharacterized protein n=1 Tax=Anguilla anguilla TaxID=7936 RepID=A0A0E9SAP8_ANGAN